jgi:Domain of unknown function (DUF4440)
MRTAVAGVVVVAGALVLVRAGGYSVSIRSVGDHEAAVANLQEIEKLRMRAVVGADMRVLDRLHAADYQAVPPPGNRLDREQFLTAVATGDLDFLAYEAVLPIEVRLYDKAAVLSYRSRIDVVAIGEGRFTHESWHTCVYELRDGRWQLVREQTTAVGGACTVSRDGRHHCGVLCGGGCGGSAGLAPTSFCRCGHSVSRARPLRFTGPRSPPRTDAPGTRPTRSRWHRLRHVLEQA